VSWTRPVGCVPLASRHGPGENHTPARETIGMPLLKLLYESWDVATDPVKSFRVKIIREEDRIWLFVECPCCRRRFYVAPPEPSPVRLELEYDAELRKYRWSDQDPMPRWASGVLNPESSTPDWQLFPFIPLLFPCAVPLLPPPDDGSKIERWTSP
jgi:hypothetical protein